METLKNSVGEDISFDGNFMVIIFGHEYKMHVFSQKQLMVFDSKLAFLQYVDIL